MRRTLYALAVLAFGAASAASAQARAITLARLIAPHDSVPTTVAVHVSNLLDDPEWLEPWRNAYMIRIHWRVQLWRRLGLGLTTPQRVVEWDVLVQQVPLMDLFNYTERINGQAKTISFRTFDSLKAHLTEDVGIPAQQRLASGDYFFRVEVRLSTSEKDPFDSRTPADVGLLQKLVGLASSSTHSRDLPTVDKPFTVP